jgi:paspaline synthase
MPTSAAQVVAFVPWLIINIGIVYTTWKFGPEEWKHSPLVARNLRWILMLGIAIMIGAFWTFISTVGIDAASFYLGYADQFLVSCTSLAQLLRRGSTAGNSWGIWYVQTYNQFNYSA